MAAVFKGRLEKARASCASIVEATNIANAEHLASGANTDTSVDREPGVAAQAADPKTGLAGGGRKKKRREKRHLAAQGHLCAHRWCNRFCRNWAAGHVLCILCNRYRLHSLDDIKEWREDLDGYYQTWFDWQVQDHHPMYGDKEWHQEEDGKWTRGEMWITHDCHGCANDGWPVINGIDPQGINKPQAGPTNPATKEPHRAYCVALRTRKIEAERAQARPSSLSRLQCLQRQH